MIKFDNFIGIVTMCHPLGIDACRCLVISLQSGHKDIDVLGQKQQIPYSSSTRVPRPSHGDYVGEQWTMVSVPVDNY